MALSKLSAFALLVLLLYTQIVPAQARSTIQHHQVHDEDLLIILGLAYVHIQKLKRRRRTKKVWVNAYLRERRTKGRYFRDFQDMKDNPSVFRENFHMSPLQFQCLLDLVRDKLESKKKARISDNICAEEKLCVTLEYLASGSLQRHIGSVYRISKQRIGPIIESTCDAIYESLKETHLQELNKKQWISESNKFNARWNFPNCIGAIDGKHVAITCPNNANSLFFNYKGFHSIVLMAVANADYKFLYIDIGAYGSEGDSSVFRKSKFGKSLFDGKLQLPRNLPINGIHVPHLFLADDAFPLTKHIMKPFKPVRKGIALSREECVFNYRLSRARRCVENSFGILCARWICLARTLFLNPNRAQKVVACCCVLHNMLMKEDADSYCPVGFADSEDSHGIIVPGNWRRSIPENSMYNSELESQSAGRPAAQANAIRNHLKEYFSSPAGQLEWQNEFRKNYQYYYPCWIAKVKMSSRTLESK